MKTTLAPVHPGEVLLEEFMQPLGVTQYRLAKETNVPPRRINEIVYGRRAVTADTALRVARYFGTSEMFLLNLQARYDLQIQLKNLCTRLATVLPFGEKPKRMTSPSRSQRALVRASKSG